MKNDNVICILAKCPIPGDVKPRLEEYLGRKEASFLARAFLMDSIATALRVPHTDVNMAFCPPDALTQFQDIVFLFTNEEQDKKISRLSKNIVLIPQTSGNLGDRLINLSRHFFEIHNAKRVLFVCSDNPVLDPIVLKAAFVLLKKKNAVLGPTFDGGFYLIGLSCFFHGLFENITWGDGSTYRQISERLDSQKFKWQEMEISYDVDGPDELEQLYYDIETLRLTGKNNICRHTEKCLSNLKQ